MHPVDQLLVRVGCDLQGVSLPVAPDTEDKLPVAATSHDAIQAAAGQIDGSLLHGAQRRRVLRLDLLHVVRRKPLVLLAAVVTTPPIGEKASDVWKKWWRSVWYHWTMNATYSRDGTNDVWYLFRSIRHLLTVSTTYWRHWNGHTTCIWHNRTINATYWKDVLHTLVCLDRLVPVPQNYGISSQITSGQLGVWQS